MLINRKIVGILTATLLFNSMGTLTNTYAATKLSTIGENQTVATQGDYSDTVYSFYVQASYKKGATKPNTKPRIKNTTSSVYIYAMDAEGGCQKVHTQGKIDGKWNNYTINGYAIIPENSKRRIRNTIVENNGGKATNTRLTFKLYRKPAVNTGKWSPDCKGSYPSAN